MNEIFNYAKIKLKATCSYQASTHTKDLFTQDINGNIIENWDFYISHQDDIYAENSIWFTIIARDKEGNNITQIDFDDISKDQLSDLIKQLAYLYKEIR